MATVKLSLKRNRQAKDGSFPIYLVICHQGKRKELALGVNVTLSAWNAKNELISKKFPNAVQLNQLISKRKNDVVERLRSFEAEGKAFSIEMLIEEKKKLTTKVDELISTLIEERHLSPSTASHYNYLQNLLFEHFKRHISIDELTHAQLLSLSKAWEGKVSDGTLRLVMSKLQSLVYFAMEHKLISENPFERYHFAKKYKPSNRLYFLSRAQLLVIKQFFLSLTVEQHENGNWSYKDGAYERLHETRATLEFGLALWLACFYLNGSAPMDVAMLKPSNVEQVAIGGVKHFKITFKRQKTNQPVTVLWKRDMMSIILLEHFLGQAKTYIYQVLKQPTTDKKLIRSQLGHLTTNLTRILRKELQRCNAVIARLNAEKGLNEPLIDIKQFCYYTARHSFASLYLSQPRASLRGLATLMGRTVASLDVYVHKLTNDSEIAAEGVQSLV